MNALRESQYELRQAAVAALRADLFGPANGEEEILDDAPATRYATGMLFPEVEEEPVSDEQDHDVLEDGEEGSAPDPGVARAAARQPSSCGITFAVAVAVSTSVRLSVSAARYVPADADGRPLDDFDPKNYELLAGRWRRVPVRPVDVDVDVCGPNDHRFSIHDDLDLFVRVRKQDDRGVVAVTAVLLNTHKARAGELRDAFTYFQAGVEASGSDDRACFAERRFGTALVDDDELASYDLLYRHAKSYAVGHGCSAVWEAEPDAELARRVRSEFIPEFPVNLADSNREIAGSALSMRFCAEAPTANLVDSLRGLRDDYLSWIHDVAKQGDALGPRYRDAVERHVAECRTTCNRLAKGIDLLQGDADSLRAFRLANEAMRIQRARTEWAREGRPGDGPPAGADGRWRPFQLAFILLCLPGIADPSDDERDVVDLLWFPTGGGKTEAYLGLIAFAIFRRRLTRVNGAGVTVFMRYTLRLLTIQQFARAALLICCCEHLRATRPDLGNERISIGLWVGRGATPNTRQEAKTALNLIQQGGDPTDGDPRQLQACPWCGTTLRTDHYWPGDNPPRIAISCRTNGCDFRSGLPVYVVDQDIYDYRPSLLIATADKFASLPWNPDIRSLFGAGELPPPELIVQDELHLISGPLGTLAGLYETAIDHLCRDSGNVRPKVIASTATIRRAWQQVSALFDRRMHQFPPPGIDARDSYFAVEASPEHRGNRLYVGVMAPATSQTTAMVRTYGRLLATVEASDRPAEVRDPYWTLLGYFNSLRVLGGARMQVQDDVVDRLAACSGATPSGLWSRSR